MVTKTAARRRPSVEARPSGSALGATRSPESRTKSLRGASVWLIRSQPSEAGKVRALPRFSANQAHALLRAVSRLVSTPGVHGAPALEKHYSRHGRTKLHSPILAGSNTSVGN